MDGSILIQRQKLLTHPMLSAGWRAFTGLKTLLLDHRGEQNLPNPILLGIWIHRRWLVLWVTILIAIDVPIRQIARKKCEISSNTLLNKTWGTFNMIKNISQYTYICENIFAFIARKIHKIVGINHKLTKDFSPNVTLNSVIWNSISMLVTTATFMKDVESIWSLGTGKLGKWFSENIYDL